MSIVGARCDSRERRLTQLAASDYNVEIRPAEFVFRETCTPGAAAPKPPGDLHQQFQRQVSLLSFMDCFRVIAWLTLAAVPLLLYVQRFKPAGKAPASH